MKFTESQLEQAFIELLAEEEIPHLFVQSIKRTPEEVLIKEDLKNFLLHSGKLPQFKEEDLFEVIAPMIEEKTTTKTTTKTTSKSSLEILKLIETNPMIKAKEMGLIIRLSEEGVRYHLKKLKKDKLIQYIGSAKTGHWEIILPDAPITEEA